MDQQTIIQRIERRLPPFARRLHQALEDAGFEAYFVGGFIRDAILNRDAYDIDITTNALWEQVREVSLKAGFRTYETGVKHGTITVIDPDGDLAIEVTTYRIDGAYRDARHPEKVEFVSSLSEDLRRRDFTMNAIAYSPRTGIADPLEGITDIENRVIRVVGDGNKRFTEDGLRVLRAARFASQLGFSIEEHTFASMLKNKNVLSYVSTERITHELDCLLLGDYVFQALTDTVDVISFALPELVALRGCTQNTKYHIYDVFDHTMHVVQNTHAQRLNRWVALCHDMGKPAASFSDDEGVEHFYGHARVSVQIARSLMKRLLMSPSFIDDACTLILYHDSEIAPTKTSVKKMLRKLDGRQDLMRVLLDIKRADAKGQAPMCYPRIETIDTIEAILNEVIEAQEAFAIKDLAINGRDLIQLGIQKGPVYKTILTDALDKVIEEKINNDRDQLLAYIQKAYL